MPHISLYRKYRPATFEEIIGQDHVTRTLTGAIATGKVSHAYLFAGSRGTGKTSTAKLLAKALNCVNGPTATPCGECESCRAIGAGSSLDVIEMDAASNRGIDDIRDIRDRVAFATVEGKYRVYILDEAHMLTKEASNAFLKVLEEPPGHVIFVLCTTEAHKVIPTIQSRCQKFEFRRPDANMIIEVLGRIAAAEGIEIDDAGLAAIARSSGGAFRDAIGVLDQLATYCEKKISVSDVLSMLGAVESDLLFEAVDIVAENDARGSILFIDRLAERGRDFGQFAQELIAHLRNIFLLKQLDDRAAGVLSVPDEDLQRLKAQARIVSTAQVLRFVELLSGACAQMRQGSDSRLQLELAFIHMTQPQVDMSTKSLLYRMEQLEKQMKEGGMPPGSGASRDTGEKAVGAVSGSGSRADPGKSPPAVTEEPAGPAEAGESEATGKAAGEPASEIELTLDRLARAWSIILSQVEKRKIPLASVLREARPVGLEGAVLTLGFPAGADFHRSQVEKPENMAVLAGVLKEHTGAALKVSCRVAEGMTPVRSAPEPRDDEKIPTMDEMIDRLKNEFGAEEIP